MVKLTEKEEHVKRLITDTVNLISRNGLEFEKLKIHATIGITINDERTFVIGFDKKFEKGADNEIMLNLPPTSTPTSVAMATQFMPDLTKVSALHLSQMKNMAMYAPHQLNYGPKAPQEMIQEIANAQSRKRSHSQSGGDGVESRGSHTPFQQHKHAKIQPISVVPESAQIDDEDDDDDEQPQNLVIKEEATSDTENHEQCAPLNMSVSSHDQPRSHTPLREPQVQALPGPVSSPIFPDKEDSPQPTANSEQSSPWSAPSAHSLLKTALNNIPRPKSTPSPKTPKSSPVGEKRIDGKDGDIGYVMTQSQTSTFQVEKKYVCDQVGCSYTSSRKYNLTRHARTHYEDQRIPCPECSGTFVDKYILKEHMASAHPKFQFPINGTNTIGVGIGTTTVQSELLIGPLLPDQERPTIPPTFFQNPTTPSQPVNRRKKTTPSRNGERKTQTPNGLMKGRTSPKSGSKVSSMPWHQVAPHQQPPTENVSASEMEATATKSLSDMMKIMPGQDMLDENIPPSMQSVFPGMMELNNNEPKMDDENEEQSPASSPSSSGANLVVFPGMMVESQSNGMDESSPAPIAATVTAAE